MKFRTDFITNSSSSSFIVAYSNHFTEEQRNRLVDFALKNFLGDDTCSTEEELVEYFNKMHGLYFKVGEFTDPNGNLKELFDDDNKTLKEEFIEKYGRISSELYDYITCLKEIKQGNSINFGSLDFEDDIPIYSLQRLQREFWDALKSDNFKTIDDNLDF